MKKEQEIYRTANYQIIVVIAGHCSRAGGVYGPSLTGQKILLPLDILTQPGVYIPRTPETAKIVPHNWTLSDLVYQFEPDRQFADFRISSRPVPIVGTISVRRRSFYMAEIFAVPAFGMLHQSPVILAWAQLFAALVAGTDMFFFCRKSLHVGFWPATVCAWCYPLTAFFVLWQGYFTALAVYWLPWIFLSLTKRSAGKIRWRQSDLSLVTFLVLASGHIDIAGQVLLGSGDLCHLVLVEHVSWRMVSPEITIGRRFAGCWLGDRFFARGAAPDAAAGICQNWFPNNASQRGRWKNGLRWD